MLTRPLALHKQSRLSIDCICSRLENIMPHYFRDTIHKAGDRNYISGVLALQNRPVVGEGTCVDLIKIYVPSLKGKSTAMWRPGKRLIDMTKEEQQSLLPGTVIATFENGKFPQRKGGQHVGFYIRTSGVEKDRMSEAVIMDQFKTYNGVPRPYIGTRMIPARPKLRHLPNGDPDYSNDLAYFFVVE